MTNARTLGDLPPNPTAVNLSGGVVGSIPYQSLAGQTSMLAPGTTNQILTSAGGTAPVWAYSTVKQNPQNGNYTLAATDSSGNVYSKNAGAQTLTIPTNASVPIPVDSAFTVTNNGTTAITISSTGVTVYKAGTSAAWASGGTIAVRGMATFLKVETDVWFVSGAGLS